MNVNAIVNALNDIKNIGSSKQKESILEKVVTSNPEIRIVLNAALATDQRYGIIVQPNDLFINNEQSDFLNVLYHLIDNRPHNNNEKKAELLRLVSGLPEEQRDLMVRIINKDLNIGIGTTIVNKVLKKANREPIRNLQPMKAQKETEAMLDSLFVNKAPTGSNMAGISALVQKKIDAARAFMVVDPDNNSAYFLSANGKRMDCFGHITHLPMLCERASVVEDKPLAPFIVDGELIAVNDDGSYMTRQKSNGLFNKAVRGTISDQEANRFVFMAWDKFYSVLGDPEFALYNGSSYTDVMNYNARYNRLGDFILKMNEDESSLLNNSVRLVESEYVGDKASALQAAKRFIDAGEEGAVVKSLLSAYEPKRSHNLVKIKKAYMADVRVTGINEGKNPGTLGSLSYETDDGLIKGDVSGIRDEAKAKWYDNPELIVGQVIEVRYMEVTTDKRTGAYTLYGPPVLIRKRIDKDETSTLEELK